VANASTAPSPLLIRFDDDIFPAGAQTAVALSQSTSLTLQGTGVVIDGTDENGQPALSGNPAGSPGSAQYNRKVILPTSGSTLVIRTAGASLIGLFIQRSDLGTGTNPNGNVVYFTGGSGTQLNRIVNCKVDGGAGHFTGKLAGKDCINGDSSAGQNWANANTVQNTEVTACPDKGVKSDGTGGSAYIVVQDSWVHNAIGGGIQATQGGALESDRNVVECNGRGGYDCSGPVAYSSASGIDDNVGSTLHSSDNISRGNLNRGISITSGTATVTNDFACGNKAGAGQNGIAVLDNNNGSFTGTATATIRGSAAVYNGRNGATVLVMQAGTSADFGTSPTPPARGNNAFTQNNTGNLGGHNFDNSTTAPPTPTPMASPIPISALGNEWQHCYASSPALNCNGPISSSDVG